MRKFDPQLFIEGQVEEIINVLGKEKALIAVSGGVDSATCAVLTYRAIGQNLVCAVLDNAFMRKEEPERVAQLLSRHPFNLPVRIINVRERFLNALKGLVDAEEKRKAFREAFYQTLSEAARDEACRFLVQGTIYADILETAGGVKTQHNVLWQVGINPVQRYGFQVVEPLKTLLKWQVRMVARCLGIPAEVSERQPFPGPGLSVRVVGEIRLDKLESLKEATAIAEEALSRHRPDQYFAVILDDVEKIGHPSQRRLEETVTRFLNIPSRQVLTRVFRDKATGIRGKNRQYGEIAALRVQTSDGRLYQPPLRDLVAFQAEIIFQSPSFTRVLYAVGEASQKRPYAVAIRAVKTRDFLTADVADTPWSTLMEASKEILKACPNVSAVYYDITPKPPATIEME